ncbi:MAG: hypothetical protein O3B73_05735 [bacterium]|nr:hypothetical protein [bacterium]
MSISSVILNASLLYNALLAQHVTLQGDQVLLDLRNTDAAVHGMLITDPIAPSDQHLVDDFTVVRWVIQTHADIPDGTGLQLFARTGSSFFTERGWTDWTPIGLAHTLSSPPGRYLQLKILFTTSDRALSPRLHAVHIQAETDPIHFDRSLEVTDVTNDVLIRSPFEFAYERQDEPAIRAFVEAHDLRALIGAETTDIARFSAVTHFVAQLPNTRHDMWREAYPWTLDELLVQEAGHPAVKGHCMSYASVLISSLTGLGYYARHWAVEGFRHMNHEVVEVWSDELGKWIYLDPSLDQHYSDPKTGQPLSLLEIHHIFAKTFFKEGETLFMPMAQQLARVQSVGGKNAPIVCHDLGFHYGVPTSDYDWGWLHGYLAAGFLRLTTRNNFHSQPEPAFAFFGEGNEDDHGFPSWVDARTPPRTDRIRIFSGRERDFYWTLNQAVFKATRTAENAIELELSQSQPFFSHYRLTANGETRTLTANTCSLPLIKGDQIFSVAPVDRWGKEGRASMLAIHF